MAGPELDAGAGECEFPHVRKSYWRSATWVGSRSAPPSPKGEGEQEGQVNRASLQRQNSRARASLPPLQPLAIARRSLDEWPRAEMDNMGDWSIPVTPGRRRVKMGPEMKLDLASVHRTPAKPTEIQLKREKFAFYDKECSRVANYHIFLGSDAVAKNLEKLRANGITHVLNCVGFVCPEYFKGDLVYKTLWLQDSPCEDITSLLYDVFDYFEEVKEQGGRVFVHCCQGISRSASFVIAYLMWREHLSFEDAFQDVKAARGVTNPNMGFACQLLQCQKRVHAAPMSPNSVLRMYRLAPHSPYDPLHLVPKMVHNAGAGALDSRGAFVLHVPLAIYVWIGHHCDPKLAEAAKIAANQVIRYERAEGPLHIYAEGQEEAEFWECLSKQAHSSDVPDNIDREDDQRMGFSTDPRTLRASQLLQFEKVRKIEPGNKRVFSYDVDFELYQRARQGGVVPPAGGVMASTPTRIPAREDGWSLLRKKFLSGVLLTTVAEQKEDSSNPSSPSHSASPSPLPKKLHAETSIPLQEVPSHIELHVGSPNSSSGASSPSTSQANSPCSSHSMSSPDSSHANSPCSSQSASSPDNSPFNIVYSSTGNQSSFPSRLKSLAPHLATRSSGECLVPSGGTMSSPLSMPGLEDNPPPAPRSMSRKPRLPPLFTVKLESAAAESGLQFERVTDLCKSLDHDVDHDMQDTDCRRIDSESFSFPDQSQSSLLQDINDWGPSDLQTQRSPSLATFLLTGSRGTLKETLEYGHPVLYAWPTLERLEMFDADDLDSKGLFILVAPWQGAHAHESKVYVWVGREQLADMEKRNGNAGDAVWQQAGQLFLKQMKCWKDIPLRQVVREGHEPEDFWENFNNG